MRWMLATAIGVAGLAACAAGTESAGPATGGGGTGGATSASSSSASSSSGKPSICGNGVKEPGEQCDNEDFGDVTCKTFGFASGDLACNDECGIVAAMCQPPEICFNGGDDDDDGLIDCQDPECAGTSACADTCTPAAPMSLPGITFGDNSGRPAVHAASCSTASGQEMIYVVTAVASGTMTLWLASSAADFSVSVRTACGDDASEIGCANAPMDTSNGTDQQALSVPVTAGATYYVMVDGNTPQDLGLFQLQLKLPLPETDCTNLVDDDLDGYVDCDDPICQAQSVCTPGAKALGQPCSLPSDCAANHNDPACLGFGQGFPGSYCAEFCDDAADDCGPGGVCATGLVPSVHGVCLQACTQSADCRAGYVCTDLGLAKKACMISPETDCTNQLDDDADGLIDCEDPDCQASPACVPGPAAAGQPCAANTDCAADHDDPICLSLPSGYCSQFCSTSPDDCPSGSVCTFAGPAGAAVCMQTCTSQAQCRAGYTCQDVGLPETICW